MSEKISIACPSCHKSYSVPANLGDRKLKCKACGSGFRLSDLQSPQVTLVPAKQDPTPRSSLGGADKINLQGMFKPSIPNAMHGSNVAGSNPYDQDAQPRLGRIEHRQLEHRRNSKMLLAVFGSILVCVLLIPACYFLNVAITSTFSKTAEPQRRNRKQNVSADRPVSSSGLVLVDCSQRSPESLSWKSK